MLQKSVEIIFAQVLHVVYLNKLLLKLFSNINEVWVLVCCSASTTGCVKTLYLNAHILRKICKTRLAT